MVVSETSSVAVFTLFYLIITVCFVFRTSEFLSAGFTVEHIFARILGNEIDNFIEYNIKLTSLNLVIHSFLPLGYCIGVSCTVSASYNSLFSSIWWTTYSIFSLLFPLLTLCLVFYWYLTKCDKHPTAELLSNFCDDSHSWRSIALDINEEYKRVEKIVLRTSTISKVIATDNWLIKTSLYSLCITHQSDSVLVLSSADTHQVSAEGPGAIQYVNIDVITTRPQVKPFKIRCRALEFEDLQSKVRRPIRILEGVKFHKSTIDRFLEVFQEAVQHNPPYRPSAQILIEPCIGCMAVDSNVKLVKQCSEENCSNCYCRPLWCITCMGRWFASRQEQDKPETWLNSSCTCPLCRSVFCILDVCPLETS